MVDEKHREHLEADEELGGDPILGVHGGGEGRRHGPEPGAEERVGRRREGGDVVQLATRVLEDVPGMPLEEDTLDQRLEIDRVSERG